MKVGVGWRNGSKLAAALLMCTGMAWAQQGATSRATGVVTDPTGAVVPGAVVVLTNEGTNLAHVAKTTSAGVYVITGVPVGTYSIKVTKSGFKTFASAHNVLAVGTPMTVNVRLQVGAAAQQVNVTAAAQLVQTSSSANFGNVVNQKTIQQLPLVGVRGRNPLSLDLYQPGVVTGSNAGGGVSVDGSRDYNWSFTLDGISIVDPTQPGANFTQIRPNPDSISEFKVTTSNFSAANGDTSGGHLAMVTRQGTNQFHGDGFEFYQTPALNANAYDNNLDNLGKSDFVQNIYGFSVGGPIQKNKTFFFTDLQYLHAHESVVETSSVLTQDARAGLFRYVTSGRNENASGTSPSVDQSGSVLPGVNVDSYNIASNPQGLPLDSTIQKIISTTAEPNNFNTGDGLNFAGYTWTPAENDNNINWTFRLDHTFNASNEAYLRWTQGRNTSLGDTANGGLATFPELPNAENTHRVPTGLAIGWTSNITPNVTNQFVTGYTHSLEAFDNGNPDYASVAPYNLGIVTNPLSNAVGDWRTLATPQVRDDLTWLRGAHNLQFGAFFQDTVYIEYEPTLSDVNVMPYVDFSTAVDPVSTSAFAIPSGMNSVDRANLESTINTELGRVGLIQQSYVSNASGSEYEPAGTGLSMETQLPQLEFYAQDAWHVNRNLVFNYGLRWDMMFNIRDPRNRILVPNQSLTVGATPTNTAAWESGNLFQSRKALLGPSVGLAWDPFGTGKTSVRVHYGMYYDPVLPYAFSAGVIPDSPGLSFVAQNFTFGEGGGLVSQGVPTAAPPAGLTPQQLRRPPAFGNGGVDVADPNWRPAQVSQWGLSLQRQLSATMVLTASYIGEHGAHLYGSYENSVVYPSAAFVQAFNTVQAGGDSALMDQIMSADPNLRGRTGSVYIRDNYPTQLAQNDVAGLASDLNQIEEGGEGLVQASGLSPSFFQPDPQFNGFLSVLNSDDWSNYNSLQIQLQRRFSAGLTFLTSYTWSKSMDTGSFDPDFTRVGTGNTQTASNSPYDNDNIALNYALSDFNRPNALQTGFVWNLGGGKNWGGADPWIQRLARGWSVSGIVNWLDGRPFTVYSGSYTYGSLVESPAECTGCTHSDAYLATNQTTGNREIFTPQQAAQFSIPAAGTLGNTSRNFFRLPNNFSADMSVAKDIQITEYQRLELRADASNIFNHPTYGLADSSTITSSVFGQMRDAVISTERRIQLGIKYYF
ncbi:MAG: carboxypeptidase regulatory-like domain-containing protein [Terriglobales bacterium]